MNWPKTLLGSLKSDQLLKNHTTFKIGGRAECFFEPKNTVELKEFLAVAKKSCIKFMVIGSGSNILAADRPIKKPIIKLNSPDFKKIRFKGRFIQAGAGMPLAYLIKEAKKRDLSCLEFLTTLPATLGGALAMNAGAWGKSISDFVEDITFMDYNGKIKSLKKDKLKFAYRKSGLNKIIILSCRLKADYKKQKEIDSEIKKYLKLRKDKQDTSRPSAGCIFKNPTGFSAGRLIDLAGLKGRHIGGAYVSQKHANFILNKNNASAEDVLSLIKLIRKEIKKKFKINLTSEIKIWR